MRNKNHKIFIVAGEASGDIYGAQIAGEILSSSSAEIRGWGGDIMSSAGVHVSKHYSELAFMGFVEVLLNLRTIRRNLNSCWNEIVNFKPDAVVLVDFPGFNMRIARKAKKAGIKTYQVICPQVWAWKASRIKKLKRDYDAVFPALPFEDQVLKKGGVNSQSLGHPIIDTFDNFKYEKKKGLIALLPGSRRQELRKMLPVLIEVSQRLKEYDFVIAGAPGLKKEDYGDLGDVELVFGDTRKILAESEMAIVTSGTATLEAALLGTKQLIAYKTSELNYLIAKALVKVKHIGLPNLILGREIVPELIQNDCTSAKIIEQIKVIRQESAQISGYKELREKLGISGASKRIANYIIKDSSSS